MTMRICTEEEDIPFKPVTLSITLETEQDLRMLYAMTNAAPVVFKGREGEYGLTPSGHFSTELHRELKGACRARGLKRNLAY